MVETKLLLELLMRLLTDPSGFDRGGEHSEGSHRLVSSTHSIFACQRPAFADEPDLVARHALHTIIAHAVLMAIRNADPAGREEACQPTFGAPPPTDPLPRRCGQQHFSSDRGLIGDVIFAGLSGLRDGKIRATSAG